MSILTKNKTDFKPQFLFIDEDWIASKIREGRTIEGELNNLADEVKKIFNQPLSDEELHKIVMGKYPAAVSLLKQRAGFPDADDEVFFKITNISPSKRKAVIDAFNKFQGRYFRLDEFEINDGRFILSQEAMDNYKKIATYYTKCEKGNEAFGISRQLCEGLNQALKSHLILPGNGTPKGIEKLVKERLLKVEKYGTRHEKKITEFVPNYKEISYIREKEN